MGTNTLVKLCEPHLGAIFIVIAVMTLLFAAGGGLKPLIKIIGKWFSGGKTEVNVNISGAEGREMERHKEATTEEVHEHGVNMGEIMAAKPPFCNPGECHAFQQAEREIESLKNEVGKTNDVVFRKLTFIKNQNNVMLRAMVKAGQLNEADIPLEPMI